MVSSLLFTVLGQAKLMLSHLEIHVENVPLGSIHHPPLPRFFGLAYYIRLVSCTPYIKVVSSSYQAT